MELKMAEQKKGKIQIPADLVDAYDRTYKSSASQYNIGRTFVNNAPNISVRSEYTRDDYDYYRQYENTQRNTYENIRLSLRAYDKVGIVRNVIELMSDFVCKGIKLIHPVASQERFYQQWFDHVCGYSVSERFANYLYRVANVPVNITYGTVPVKIERKWKSANANETELKDEKVERRRIPLSYTFINPLNIEVLAPELALFTGKPLYALRVNTGLLNAYNAGAKQIFMPTADNTDYSNLIPAHILEALKKGQNLIPINNENFRIYFYKKDDWKIWADSMIVPIMDDLIVLDKMKLADISALDGAVSSIRLWTMGHIGDTPENSLIPTKAQLNKLRNILANNVGGGTIDLVWGPELKFQDSASEVYKFLGKQKYEPTLANIYEGLGVPFVSDAGGKGMTNNFIQMQTFVERLQYGRRTLTNFWNEEIKKVQKAMGYKKPAIVCYDQINLGDDTTYKQFLLGLLDRDAISVDTILNACGFFSNIERIKIRKEYGMRDSKKIPTKASPFHSPQTEDDMKKLVLQSGGVAPSELGIDLKPRKKGEKSPNEHAHETALQLADKNNKAKITQSKYKARNNGNGRPKGKKDSTKRKTKTPPLHTKGFTNTFIWGYKAQAEISEILTPILLENLYKKPNVRSLTSEETNKLEATKLLVFSNIKPFTEITPETIHLTLEQSKTMNADVSYSIKALLFSFKNKNDREPTVDEMRQIQASGYALVYEEENEETLEVSTNN